MTPIILADDLTGAMEVAAVFHRHGWRALLPFTTELQPGGTPSTIQVLSTETRNEKPAAAQHLITALLAGLRTADAGILFKKIDSTMRGPIGAELAAIRSAHPGRPVFVTPANPIVGRTVRDGVLYLNNTRITATAFRNDPVSPVLHDDLANIIASTGGAELAPMSIPLAILRTDPETCATYISNQIATGQYLFTADAETSTDLDTLVQATHFAHEQPLLVGSGALAASLAKHIPQPSSATAATPTAPGIQRSPLLFACGSMHPISRRQMQGLNLPIHTLPFSSDAARSVIANIADELERIGSAAFVLEPNQPVTAAQWLDVTTRTVTAIHNRQRLGALFVTGGETARSVCQRLGGAALELLGEIEQGVAAARLDTPRGPILVITKPGGFGDDNTLARVQRWIAQY